MTTHTLDVKERIISTATELFHRQGYTKTGINQIIKESNIARASLYYHFKTKDDLCIAYLKRRGENWSKDLNLFLKDKDDKVIALFDYLIIDNEKSDFRGCTFLNILSEIPPNNLAILQEVREQKLSLQQFFNKNISNTEVSYTVYSLFENAIIESQLFRNQEPVLRLKAIVKNLL